MPEEERGEESHFTFESTARSLEIPPENWENPEVRRFIGLVNTLENLQVDLATAEAANINETLAHTREKFGAPDMVIKLQDRYGIGELSLRALLQIMKEGFGEMPGPTGKNYIKSKLNVALNRLGLQVEEISKGQ